MPVSLFGGIRLLSRGGALRDIRRESPGEFQLTLVTAATVVALGVEQGILLAIVLSLFRHVRHSYRPHTTMLTPDATGRWVPIPATPGQVTEPGLIVYRFGADLFYANQNRFADEVRALVSHAPGALRWFVVDAGAITDIDYTAELSLRWEISSANRLRSSLGASAPTCGPTWTGTASPPPWERPMCLKRCTKRWPWRGVGRRPSASRLR